MLNSMVVFGRAHSDVLNNCWLLAYEARMQYGVRELAGAAEGLMVWVKSSHRALRLLFLLCNPHFFHLLPASHAKLPAVTHREAPHYTHYCQRPVCYRVETLGTSTYPRMHEPRRSEWITTNGFSAANDLRRTENKIMRKILAKVNKRLNRSYRSSQLDRNDAGLLKSPKSGCQR